MTEHFLSHVQPCEIESPVSCLQVLSTERQAYDAELAHRRLLSEVAITDILTRDDMEEDNGLLMHPCRCGGTFLLPHREKEGHAGPSVIIQCDTCSLFIEVLS